MGFISNLFLSPEQKMMKESLDFKYGPYSLNESISGIPGLREVSKEEYNIYGRTFKNEIVYNGNPIKYLGSEWDVVIGVVNKNIYKININNITISQYEHLQTAKNMQNFIEESIGKADKAGNVNTAMIVNLQWISTGGNLILQVFAHIDKFHISIFLTSSSVRNYELI